MNNKIKDCLPEEPKDENRKKYDRYQFGNCKVCNDRASGIHYGVASCEGCKGFYKRTVLQKKLYHCNFGNDCNINAQERKRCKACRLKKCLMVGMSLDGVKLGRIPLFKKVEMLHKQELKQPVLDDESEQSSQKSSSISPFKSVEAQDSIEDLFLNLPNDQQTSKVLNQDSNFNEKIETDYLVQNNPGAKTNDCIYNDLDCIIKEIIEKNNNETTDEVEIVRKALEKQLDPFEKGKKQYLIDLNERDDYIRKHFDLDSFFKINKKFYESQSFLNNNLSIEDSFFDTENENILYLLTIIRENANKLYIDFIKPVEQDIKQSNEKLKHPENLNREIEYTRENLWPIFKEFLKSLVPNFVSYAKELPGFSEICQHDFTTILDDNLPCLFAFRLTKLYRNNESYLVVANIHFDRNLKTLLFGNEIMDPVFEFHMELIDICLTNNEIALLIPFILSSPDVPLVDENFMRELNMNYARALLYEFSLNNRGCSFLKKVVHIIGLMQMIKKAFVNADGPFFI